MLIFQLEYYPIVKLLPISLFVHVPPPVLEFLALYLVTILKLLIALIIHNSAHK